MSAPSRYIPHTGPPNDSSVPLQATISTALVHAISLVNLDTTSNTRGENVYFGRAGIALMNYYLSDLMLSSKTLQTLHPSQPDLRSIGDKCLAQALCSVREKYGTNRGLSHISYLETCIGVATLVLSRILEGSDKHLEHWRYCEQLMRRGMDQMHPRGPEEVEDGCEVLYGGAGFLYALLKVRGALKRRSATARWPPSFIESLEDLTSDGRIGVVVGAIIQRGRTGSRAFAASASAHLGHGNPPLMWMWHKKRYLGAAHGLAGILQVLWTCPAHIVMPYLDDMIGTLEWLLARQDDSGNWPSSVQEQRPGSGTNKLVQWCHGAPGILILLSTVLRRSISEPKQFPLTQALHHKIVASLASGASLVYSHGFLRKGVGICHGVAGSVFALLAVSDVLDDRAPDVPLGGEPPRVGNRYLGWAAQLACLATAYEGLTAGGEMSTPDAPSSLYGGLAGMCCAWADVLCRLTEGTGRGRPCVGGIPGYSDYWP